MVDISEALCYCHAGGIIHRDLTPRNILILNGKFKLSDFGISKQITENSKASSFTNAWNINYQSPERLEGLEYNTKSDIWSLGCILY